MSVLGGCNLVSDCLCLSRRKAPKRCPLPPPLPMPPPVHIPTAIAPGGGPLCHGRKQAACFDNLSSVSIHCSPFLPSRYSSRPSLARPPAGDSFPTGFVVANDADFKRCNLLTHQTKRVCSPCLLVTNHSAEQFPEVRTLGEAGAEVPLRFDRVLADVPCSGDGTMRKAPDIWRRWGVGGGNGLHLVQLRVALQGCRLLKVRARAHTHAHTHTHTHTRACAVGTGRACESEFGVLLFGSFILAGRMWPRGGGGAREKCGSTER
eukprot:360121-Chlamydomonas_euryale.AAC.30